MKTKAGFFLHKLDTDYIVVGLGEASKELDGFIRLNETGAFLWGLLEKGASKGELVSQICQRYENIEPAQAMADVEEFLQKIHVVLIDENT